MCVTYSKPGEYVGASTLSKAHNLLDSETQAGQRYTQTDRTHSIANLYYRTLSELSEKRDTLLGVVYYREYISTRSAIDGLSQLIIILTITLNLFFYNIHYYFILQALMLHVKRFRALCGFYTL